jgi:hypothetical protein
MKTLLPSPRLAWLIALFGLLYTTGCDPRDRTSVTLQPAAETGDTNMLSRFLARGGNVNQPIYLQGHPSSWKTALHLCAFFGRKEAVEFLLRNGADPNARDSGGESPLFDAVGGTAPLVARLEIVIVLVNAGSEVNVRNTKGVTAVETAQYLNATDIVEFLAKKGAMLTGTNSSNHEIVKP